jgi:hypothetical protein
MMEFVGRQARENRNGTEVVVVIKRVLAVSLASFAAVSGVALASSSSSPKPGQLYTSEFLTVTVGKPATKARIFVECLPTSGAAGGQWSGTVKLTHGSFKFDKQSTINKLPSGTTTGVVDVTGKFKGGEFQGTWQLGGFTCPKTSYQTKTGAGGSGG